MLPPDSIELGDVAARWRSAYVHIPFCRRRCPYCDFAVVAPGDARVGDLAGLTARYLDALHAEIEMEPSWSELDAVNLGGGTPSAIGAAEIGPVIDHLEARFGLAQGAEVSVEANPEDVTAAFVAGLTGVGATRISIGVQSLDDEVLEYLGRAHSAEEAEEAVTAAQPVLSTSIDLVFGAPAESVESWHKTVDRALALLPHHLSTYALTVERGTELWRQVRAGSAAPDDDDQAEKYHIAQQAAEAAAMVRYEVSNYSLPGNTCRYNLATWGRGEYLGFGLGAHGHRDGERTRNVRSLSAYLDAVGSGRKPEAGRERATDPEMERILLGLRRACGVDLGDYERAAGSDSGLRRLVDAGVAELSRGRLRVLEPLLTDEVAGSVLSLSP